MSCSGRLRATIGALLLVSLVSTWGVVLHHTHRDGQFRPSCPACQQERVVSGQPAQVHAGPADLVPVFLSDGIQIWAADLVRLEPIPSQQSPRSPPSV